MQVPGEEGRRPRPPGSARLRRGVVDLLSKGEAPLYREIPYTGKSLIQGNPLYRENQYHK